MTFLKTDTMHYKGIDLFAGGGGTTTGATEAGVEIVWAGNHVPKIVEYHKLNHPNTIHSCQDLKQADWSELPPFDIMYASPCCQGHSYAAGKARKSKKADKSRSTAWAPVDCLDVHDTELAIIENTDGFLDWRLFSAWEHSLKSMGYAVSQNLINLADLGCAQSRERMFFVLTKSKNPIQIKIPKRDRRPARDIIDLNFEGHKWDLVTNKVPATQLRVRNGRKQFGDVFLDAAYGSARTGRSLDKPLGTVTTVNKHYLVNGEYIRPLNVKELALAQTFPENYIWPDSVTDTKLMLGNAVPPYMAKELTSAIFRAI